MGAAVRKIKQGKKVGKDKLVEGEVELTEGVVKKVTGKWLAKQIGQGNDYSAQGIAAKIRELVYIGKIAIGSKLPSTRELADVLGVGQATVSYAWGILRKKRMISGERRQGSWVCGLPGAYPERVYSIGLCEGDALDLTWSVSAPELVPDIYRALLHCPPATNLNQRERDSIIPELEAQIRDNWFYPADAFLAAEYIFEGSNSIFGTLLLPGSYVVVETPAPLYLLDQLDHIDAKIIPISCDGEGPILSELEEALKKNVSAFIYHPNLYAFREHPVSEERSLAMMRLFHNTQYYFHIIEYDTLGGLISAPVFSIGNYLPERTFYICSYAAYGVDARLAIASGPRELMDQIHAYRDFNCAWSSRILQGGIAWMMQDEVSQQVMAAGIDAYWQRSQALADALAVHDLIARRDIFSIWLQVPDEQHVVATLAEQGIIVLPGICSGVKGHFIRISTSLLKPELAQKVADAIASACRSSPVKKDKGK